MDAALLALRFSRTCPLLRYTPNPKRGMDLPSLSRIVDVSESGDPMVMFVYSDVGMISLSQRRGVAGRPRYRLSCTLVLKAQA